jgi:hypothetical protein
VTGADPSEPKPEPGTQDSVDWRRRRRLAEVFGETLPETTADERDPADGSRTEERSDAWLREQVPPHHG